jgi:vitamin K-dependent gamma-carboxylase
VTPTDSVSRRGAPASASVRAAFARALRAALAPIDTAWLAAFRVLFGLAMAVSMQRFIANGWIDRFFVEPRFFFKYEGFEWVQPARPEQMHLLFGVLTALALAVAAGLVFRLSAVLFAIGLSYVQLIDVSTYLNHYYLAALLSFLLAASPAQRLWSMDAWLGERMRRWRGLPEPTTAPSVARAWLWLFRFQVALVYVFAGLAKAQSDWLVHAQPLRIWLGANTELPLIGPLFTLPGVPLLMSWCGFLFDTSVVGFLLHARTRRYAYVVVIVFHTLTRILFPIGMFPVIMVLAALVFFPPDWPRPWVARLRRAFGAPRREPLPLVAARRSRWVYLPLALGSAYCVWQLVLPLRYLAYGGNVLWHEQGMRFSWRVMVRAKGGNTTFVVKNKRTGRVAYVSPRVYLTGLQESEMSSQPDLILQLAHHVRDDFERRGLGPVEVRVDSRVALNGRRSARFLDPNVDLVRLDAERNLAALVLPAPTEPPAHTRPVL